MMKNLVMKNLMMKNKIMQNAMNIQRETKELMSYQQ